MQSLLPLPPGKAWQHIVSLPFLNKHRQLILIYCGGGSPINSQKIHLLLNTISPRSTFFSKNLGSPPRAQPRIFENMGYPQRAQPSFETLSPTKLPSQGPSQRHQPKIFQTLGHLQRAQPRHFKNLGPHPTHQSRNFDNLSPHQIAQPVKEKMDQPVLTQTTQVFQKFCVFFWCSFLWFF